MTELYTNKELTEIFKVSPSALRDWRKAGQLRGVKLGGEWRYTAEEVERIKREGITPGYSKAIR